MRVGLLSDTHAPRSWKGLPDAVARAFDGVEVILHAGDVCTPEVVAQLATLAPVHVARGNNDGPEIGTPQVLLTLAGVRTVVVHDTGAAAGRMPRLRRRYPDADLVVFGHSHIPWDQAHEGLRALNPGSPTDRRRQPHGTVMVVELAGAVREVRLVEVS